MRFSPSCSVRLHRCSIGRDLLRACLRLSPRCLCANYRCSRCVLYVNIFISNLQHCLCSMRGHVSCVCEGACVCVCVCACVCLCACVRVCAPGTCTCAYMYAYTYASIFAMLQLGSIAMHVGSSLIPFPVDITSTASDCVAAGCTPNNVGNGVCDPACNVEACK